MQEQEKSTDNSLFSYKQTLFRFTLAVFFSISLGYFEAAVVVYLRAIFYPDGFDFPLVIFSIDPLVTKLFVTETGREAASIVLIFTGAWLFGNNRMQRIAYFLTIFAIWDIFYYIWLKALLDWPASIMDWDILFLIPMVWAGPVLAPVMCSGAMFLFAVIIFYYDNFGKSIQTAFFEWFAFFLACIIVIVSFCIPGPHTAQADYKIYFYWPLFAAGFLLAIGTFIRCLFKSK